MLGAARHKSRACSGELKTNTMKDIILDMFGKSPDRCDRQPHSPGRLKIEKADDHTPERGSYELIAVDNQHECVARVHTCCGRERANAERLAHAWNSYNALRWALEATKAFLDTPLSADHATIVTMINRTLDATALKSATPAHSKIKFPSLA
jgi:hypothetical protein